MIDRIEQYFRDNINVKNLKASSIEEVIEADQQIVNGTAVLITNIDTNLTNFGPVVQRSEQ